MITLTILIIENPKIFNPLLVRPIPNFGHGSSRGNTGALNGKVHDSSPHVEFQ